MVNLLSEIFGKLQKEMEAHLAISNAVSHPVEKGDLVEYCWRDWFVTYLPKRYSVTSGVVVDCTGACSDQIDLIIYDRMFSPYLLHADSFSYVPAESVYAVFEVKQTINSRNLEYAAEKCESVRKLQRTSASVYTINGDFRTFNKPIVGGLLAKTSVKNIHSPKIEKYLLSLEDNKRLDFCCSADGTGFKIETILDSFPVATCLVQFFYNLLMHLQKVGSVAAIEYDKYLNSIDEEVNE